jgi:hypothetical protein
MPLFDNTGRLGYDDCAVRAKNNQNASIIDYRTYDAYKNTRANCTRRFDELNAFAMANRNLTFRDGFGTHSCRVDADSKLKLEAELTNERFKQQLFPRVFGAIPDLARGRLLPNVESRLIHGMDTSSDKQCNRTTEKQHFRPTPCVDVQRVENVVPQWTWGGASSREIARSPAFLNMLGFDVNGIKSKC